MINDNFYTKSRDDGRCATKMCVAQSDYWLVLAAACKMSAWVREQARLRVWNDAQPRLLADCVGGGMVFVWCDP